jgi:hypothetical protein
VLVESGQSAFVRLAALGVVALSIALARPARADDAPTLSGSWSASGLSEQWTVSEWGDACGPKPAPQGPGAGAVTIRQTGGELAMSGAGRSFTTGECWEQMPGMSRTGHSGGSRGWKTTCATPANDARQAHVSTSISATDSSISLVETGQYHFVIQGQTCAASVRRSRNFTLVHREGDPEPTASAAPAAPTATASAKPKGRCADGAGEAARLEVRPGKKLLKAGDTFTFHAVVVDAEGCIVGARPSFRVSPGALAEKAHVDGNGVLTVDPDAADGRVDLAVTAGGKTVVIPVDVTNADKYDELLKARDASADEEAAVAALAAGGIGGRSALAEDRAKQRKTQFIAIVAGLAAALGFAALVIARRGRKAEAEADDGPASVVGPASMASPPPPSLEPAPPSLAPPVASKPRRRERPPRGKICPTCGEHYPPEATFCGKDATTLVLLN